MKNLLLSSFVLVSMVFFSSCGVNSALILNHNENSTQVHLAKKNFTVVEKVTGSAEIEYIFMIGGMNQRKLYENAYANMVSNANLMNSSRALVNIVTEEHIGGVPPFYFTRTLTVSANVIEFTE